MDNFLIPLFFCCIALLGYPCLCLVVILLVHSPIAWLFLATLLAPWVAGWYYVQRKRYLSYLKLLLAEPRAWNVAEAVEEYLKLLKK